MFVLAQADCPVLTLLELARGVLAEARAEVYPPDVFIVTPVHDQCVRFMEENVRARP